MSQPYNLLIKELDIRAGNKLTKQRASGRQLETLWPLAQCWICQSDHNIRTEYVAADSYMKRKTTGAIMAMNLLRGSRPVLCETMQSWEYQLADEIHGRKSFERGVQQAVYAL